MWSLLTTYGAVVLPVPREQRRPLLRRIVEEFGLHPVSNLTRTHTGHPFGPEGYKPIAYEIFLQLGRRVPAAVFVPTGYAELLFGVWKGFHELRRLGMTTAVPRMMACQPAARAPLAAAWRTGADTAEVPPSPTRAFSIGTTAAGHRGIVAMKASDGRPVSIEDAEMEAAQHAMAHAGLWQELSGSAGLAAPRSYLRHGGQLNGPVVCIATSSGFKNYDVGTVVPDPMAADWTTVEARLRAHGIA
jgi:threonine synthase